jgi:uncharacterized phiE125 gp8 family phage protein
MNIIIEQSTSQVLDVSNLKAHLRIVHDHEDVYLKSIIDMATEILEDNIELSILLKTYKYIFCDEEFAESRKIELPLRNVTEILSVEKVSHKSNKEKMDFFLDIHNGKTTILTSGSKYPTEIKYVAGLTNSVSEIPKNLKYAVLQISKNMYDCADEDILESRYIKHIINGYRICAL